MRIFIFSLVQLFFMAESWAACLSASTNPGCSINHSNGSRLMQVSWTAGTGNGGAGGCKIQLNYAGSWNDFGAAQNCDANATNLAVNLPAGDNWNGAAWASAGVRVLRISDLAVLCSMSANCAGQSGSSSATPDVDEDCDNFWDNTVSIGGYSHGTGGVLPTPNGDRVSTDPLGCRDLGYNTFSWASQRVCLDGGKPAGTGSTGQFTGGSNQYNCCGSPADAATCTWVIGWMLDYMTSVDCGDGLTYTWDANASTQYR